MTIPEDLVSSTVRSVTIAVTSKDSFIDRIKKYYLLCVKSLVLYLRSFGWKITAAVTASFLGEPICNFMASVCYLLGLVKPFRFYDLNPKEITKEQAEKRPIILIHGNYSNPSNWLSFAKELKKHDLGPVYTVYLNSGNLTEKDVTIINRKMDEIRVHYSSYGKKPVFDLVGHSRGAEMAFLMGLDKKCWKISDSGKISISKEQYSINPSIGKIVRLGLSTSKTWLSHIKPDLLSKLHEVDGEYDIIREDDEYSSLDSKHKLVVSCGHLGVLYTKQAQSQVVNWLTS